MRGSPHCLLGLLTGTQFRRWCPGAVSQPRSVLGPICVGPSVLASITLYFRWWFLCLPPWVECVGPSSRTLLMDPAVLILPSGLQGQ